MFKDSKEFLLRFKSLEDLQKFSSTYPFYYDKCKGQFEFDDCFYTIILSSEFEHVRYYLYNFGLQGEVFFCYPTAYLVEPIL